MLSEVTRNGLTWNALGEKIARRNQEDAVVIYRVLDELDAPKSHDPPIWSQAKQLIHAAMTSRNFDRDPAAKRLRRHQYTSTALLLSGLGLWLAGRLGISLSATRPMVAVMLHAVYQTHGNWDVLRDG